MAMGRQRASQGQMMVMWDELPKSPGHAFYDRLQAVLLDPGFDACVEALCQPFYAATMGAPSLPPGRYFRMHLIGYFEGIASERGLEWRSADSLSLPGLPRAQAGRAGARPFVAQPDPGPPAARGARTGLCLGARAARRARPDQGWADRHRRLDHGSERGDAFDPKAGYRRDLPRDAHPNGQRERDPDPDGGRAQADGPEAQGQADLERRLDEPDRSRGQDHPDEGRPDEARLQAGTRGRSRHRCRARGRDASRRRTRHRHARRHA